ncbi:MAG: HpaII family restriction endonuclease [Planktomarina sp.]
MIEKTKLKFIDLFAGIGGFHSALHQLGCECVFASEVDEAARSTYKKNYYQLSPSLFDGGFFNDDIRKISAAEIPDFDILCAGFPCQPFSQAGYKKGFSDGRDSERGNLFFNIVDILDVKRPKAFFLENVRGIVNHDGGNTFKVIRNALENELGYSFYFKVVKASDYGLPQLRPRAFMIGFRDEGFLKSFEFPPHLPLKFNMSDVFGGNCSREIGFTLRVGGAGSNINDRRNWDSYLVDNEVVRIQPKQALKIQGFPDDFCLPQSRTSAMKQLGNSVAVDAVRECASAMIKHLELIDMRTVEEKNMRRRNKGEWTELYTFLKLLVDRKLVLCDENLNATDEEFAVKKVTTLNINQAVHLDDDITDVFEGGENVPSTFNMNDQTISQFKDSILNSSRTFELAYVEQIFTDLGIEIVNGGNSLQKADIVLDLEKGATDYQNEGFGIKSMLGSKPTLLNASGSNTNFVFELCGFDENDTDTVNAINTRQKIKDRLAWIIGRGCELRFCKVEADIMHTNLQILDDGMPHLISEMLLNFYLNRVSKVDKNLEALIKGGKLGDKIGLDGYSIKVKRFLVAILLGMFSGRRWDGKYTANGSIVVKQDGSQVGFHITKLDVLENYLFKSIKFDTPSTTRHRFASVYKERDGKCYIKLNLQLRY